MFCFCITSAFIPLIHRSLILFFCSVVLCRSSFSFFTTRSPSVPRWIIAIVTFVNHLASFNISLLLATPECSGAIDERQRWQSGVFIPVFVGALLGIWALLAQCWIGGVKQNKPAAKLTNHLILQASVYILLLGLYQSTLRQSIQIFDCESITTNNGDTISVLAMDNGECPSQGKDAYLSVIGGLGLFLYGVVPFAVIWIQLWRTQRISPTALSERMASDDIYRILYGWASSE